MLTADKVFNFLLQSLCYESRILILNRILVSQKRERNEKKEESGQKKSFGGWKRWIFKWIWFFLFFMFCFLYFCLQVVIYANTLTNESYLWFSCLGLVAYKKVSHPTGTSLRSRIFVWTFFAMVKTYRK